MQNPGFQSTVKRAVRHGITLPCPGRVQHLHRYVLSYGTGWYHTCFRVTRVFMYGRVGDCAVGSDGPGEAELGIGLLFLRPRGGLAMHDA